eukprot:scaffold1197_cov121-Isochrysis_galbana.AAC.6
MPHHAAAIFVALSGGGVGVGGVVENALCQPDISTRIISISAAHSVRARAHIPTEHPGHRGAPRAAG